MDEVDSAIVHHLQLDGRLSNRAPAEKLGIAPSTCLERTRLLHKRGTIQGYRAQISLPEVVSVYTMTGSGDFPVHVTAQDTDRREIVGFRTSIIYQHLTNPVLDPLPPVTPPPPSAA
ncbi:Lrp/AsnC family transcriptional regulator [Streptomyces sp. NPDC007901]|uniref:Lrp/AsnC family transcriptional regulator n=1 Tax=Streptomyces sp. NPDC007901 TaxID=3364785 RepID=UPI0036E93E16